ncbi:MAG: methyltransferase domain-containing protein, partial [Gammaproteobacteria bacterium]|nr:methyltransferase domain-containing protein [Gammaproteobacteria bacterium]
FTRDDEAATIAWDKQEQKLKKEGETEEDISFQKKNFMILDAQRYFKENSFDFIFSNQALHWGDMAIIFNEIARVISPGGLFLFSTLGPDTFKELRMAWQEVDQAAHTNNFVDMHDIGDILLGERFLDPVVDMDKLSVHYGSLQALLRSLRQQGVRNMNTKRNPGLTGRHAWAAFEASVQQHQTETGKYPLTYEVVYGHAWKGEQRVTSAGVESSISVSDLRRTLR